MIYITSPSDKLLSLATEHYGCLQAKRMLDQLIAENRYIIPAIAADVNISLPPYCAIYLPDDFDPPFIASQPTLDAINSMPFEKRLLLWQICDKGIDPSILTASREAGKIKQNKTRSEPSNHTLRDTLAATAGTTSDIKEKLDEKFHENAQEVERLLQEYKSLPRATRAAYSANKIRPAYQKMLLSYRNRVTLVYSKKLSVPSQGQIQKRVLNKKGFKLMHVEEIQKITEAIKYTQLLAHGFIGLDIGLRIYDVYEAYEKHEDWSKELAKQISGFAASLLSGCFVGSALISALALTPLGWIVIIGGTMVASLITNKIGEKAGELAWSTFRKLEPYQPHITHTDNLMLQQFFISH